MMKKLILILLSVPLLMSFILPTKVPFKQSPALAQTCQDGDGICPESCTYETDRDCLVVFQDSFEEGLDKWIQHIDSPNKADIVNSPVKFGSSGLKIDFTDGTDGKYVMLSHATLPVVNVLLRGWFYDNLDDSLGTFFAVEDGSGKQTAIGVKTDLSPTYVRQRRFSFERLAYV